MSMPYFKTTYMYRVISCSSQLLDKCKTNGYFSDDTHSVKKSMIVTIKIFCGIYLRVSIL